MIALILAVISSTFIGNLLKLFHNDKSTKVLQIFLGNYFLATIFSYFMNNKPLINITLLELGLGSLTGFFFLFGFLFYQKNIAINGLSLSSGAMRFSLVIPTFASVILFKDKISIYNMIGIFAVLIAFAIITDFKKFSNIFLLFILFIITGFADLSLKIFNVYGDNSSGLFLLALFGSALIFNFIFVMIKREKWHLKSILLGLILGIPNQLTTKFFLWGLEQVSGAIAYPFFAAGVMIASIFSDIIFWKKRFKPIEYISLLIMVLGIVLINFQNFK